MMWLSDRLRERTTWLGLLGLGAVWAFAFGWGDPKSVAVVTGSLAALLLMLWPEHE